MTATVWLVVAGFFLGGMVGAHGVGEEGRRLGGAFLMALLVWCAIGSVFATYAATLGGT